MHALVVAENAADFERIFNLAERYYVLQLKNNDA